MALGAFHAHQRGVLVVCSAGNDGPDPYTVVNTAPWILTVTASTTDCAFHSSIVLGKGTIVKVLSLILVDQTASCLCATVTCPAINFSNQSLSGGRYPLVFDGQVAAKHTRVFNSRSDAVKQMWLHYNANVKEKLYKHTHVPTCWVYMHATTVTHDRWTHRRWPGTSWFALARTNHRGC